MEEGMAGAAMEVIFPRELTAAAHHLWQSYILSYNQMGYSHFLLPGDTMGNNLI